VSAAGTAVLTIPWRALAGLCEEPGQLSRIGPVTAQAARDLAAAALADPACAWKIIVVGSSGQVMAVTRIRRPRAGPPARAGTSARAGPSTRAGRAAGAGYPGAADPGDYRGEPCPAAAGGPGPGPGAGPGLISQVTLTIPGGTAASAAWLPGSGPGAAGLGEILNAALRAAADAAQRAAGRAARAHGAGTGPCDHQDAAPGYRIPGSLRDFIEARDQDCGFPVCRQPASRCDIDHCVPYHQGGPTCRCNLSAESRRHHKLKQLRNWQLGQPRPGHLIWTTPAGLTYDSTPRPHPA